jgi:hypothetical protein
LDDQVPGAESGGVEQFLKHHGVHNYTRVLFSRHSKTAADKASDVTAVYFHTPADAMRCHERVHGAIGYPNTPVYVAYREMMEPSLLVENIAEEAFDADALFHLFRRYKPAYVELNGTASCHEC